MMSDLPGEMTKQILSAPASTMRSSRYSLTAQGRSVPASSRLPTGSNSLEKASGWIRLPLPAAGTTPHISGILRMRETRRRCGAGRADVALEFAETDRAGMLGKDAVACGAADALLRRLIEIERCQCVLSVADDQHFRIRHEKMIEPVPPVGGNRRPAGSRLKQPPGRAPSVRGHVGAGDVQGERGRGKESGMLRRRQMPHEVDVVGPGKVDGVLRAGDDEFALRPGARHLNKECVERLLPVGRVGAEIGEVAGILRLRRGAMVLIRIYMAIKR